jgi:hypothetical protein
MSNLQRRYEILLPRRFNDGNAVPDDLFAETLLELRRQFGAVSSETQTIQGVWQVADEIYRDELIRVFVDLPDLPENQQFFRQYKEKLKTRFQQLEIRITTYLVEVY